MSRISVRAGIQFKTEVFKPDAPDAWLTAVGDELARRQISVKVGFGANVKEIKNSAELIAQINQMKLAANTPAQKAYVVDVLQVLDDVVKPISSTSAGEVIDVSMTSPAAKALGLSDATADNYAASTTTFGKAGAKKEVGTLVIGTNVFEVAEPIDLATTPHISGASLGGNAGWGSRGGVETEDTKMLTGLTKEQVVKLASDGLADLQRPSAARGLTVGLQSLDEMAWDAEAHAMRTSIPYLSLSLDRRRLETSPNTGEKRVAVSRDFFFDTFFEIRDIFTGKLTKALQKLAKVMFRTRIRYGGDRNETEGTRLLMGLKEDTTISEGGVKSNYKADDRRDNVSSQNIADLNKNVLVGKMPDGALASPVKLLFQLATKAGLIKKDAMVLQPLSVARQIRTRFHFNETGDGDLRAAFRDASEKLNDLVSIVNSASDWAPTGGASRKDELLRDLNGLLDRSAIVDAARPALLKIDPNLTVDVNLINQLWPDQTGQDVRLQRVVADTIRQKFDAVSQKIEASRRHIAGNTDNAVRDAGSASDVREFLRQKAVVAGFMRYAETQANPRATPGNPASYLAAATQLRNLPEADRNPRLAGMGIGLRQIEAMTEASFSSALRGDVSLISIQTMDGFISAFDAAVAGPQKDIFVKELAEFLAARSSNTLKSSPNVDATLQNIRKNLVAENLQILRRQVEAAGVWGQGSWFNNYRQTFGISPSNWGNFIIGSLDYSEFYDAATGESLTFQERASRRPLDASKMKGAMLSNDFQIELGQEQPYMKAVASSQSLVNTALAGLITSYIKEKNIAGVNTGDAASLEGWMLKQAALPADKKKAVVTELVQYAKRQGSPIDVAKVFPSLVEQTLAVSVLSEFAQKKDAAVGQDRVSIQTWYQRKLALSEDEKVKFVNELASFYAEKKVDLPITAEVLGTIDFSVWNPNTQKPNVSEHTSLLTRLQNAEEIWNMIQAAQSALSLARGAEILRIARDNGLADAKWESPTKPKGHYANDAVMPD